MRLFRRRISVAQGMPPNELTAAMRALMLDVRLAPSRPYFWLGADAE